MHRGTVAESVAGDKTTSNTTVTTTTTAAAAPATTAPRRVPYRPTSGVASPIAHVTSTLTGAPSAAAAVKHVDGGDGRATAPPPLLLDPSRSAASTSRAQSSSRISPRTATLYTTQQQQQQQQPSQSSSRPVAAAAAAAAAGGAPVHLDPANSVNSRAPDRPVTADAAPPSVSVHDVFAPAARDRVLTRSVAHVLRRERVRELLCRVLRRWVMYTAVQQQQRQRHDLHRQHTHDLSQPQRSSSSPMMRGAAAASVPSDVCGAAVAPLRGLELPHPLADAVGAPTLRRRWTPVGGDRVDDSGSSSGAAAAVAAASAASDGLQNTSEETTTTSFVVVEGEGLAEQPAGPAPRQQLLHRTTRVGVVTPVISAAAVTVPLLPLSSSSARSSSRSRSRSTSRSRSSQPNTAQRTQLSGSLVLTPTKASATANTGWGSLSPLSGRPATTTPATVSAAATAAAASAAAASAASAASAAAAERRRSMVQHLLSGKSPRNVSPHQSSAALVGVVVTAAAASPCVDASLSQSHSRSVSDMGSGGGGLLLLRSHRHRSSSGVGVGGGVGASDSEERSNSSLMYTPRSRQAGGGGGGLYGAWGTPREYESVCSDSTAPAAWMGEWTSLPQLLAREAEDRVATQAREERRWQRLLFSMSAAMDTMMMAALHRRSSERGLHPSLRASAAPTPLPLERSASSSGSDDRLSHATQESAGRVANRDRHCHDDDEDGVDTSTALSERSMHALASTRQWGNGAHVLESGSAITSTTTIPDAHRSLAAADRRTSPLPLSRAPRRNSGGTASHLP
ncbi:hypothetical protein NESM_000403100 [Novymonas esmeraldas]|uniref:Uncharacterized protein n=1 Tax=Novymonas esmeraldas TaxID=1808958 RepID=A0AAW0EPF4_9TRYP